MSGRTERFLRSALAGTRGAYRRRAERELREHLHALYQDLLDGGTPPEEAEAAALARMGAPETLRREYRAAQSALTPVWRRLVPGLLLAGLVYLIVFALVPLPYDGFTAAEASRTGWALALTTYPCAALYFGLAFRRRAEGPRWTALALLATWCAEKAGVLLLSSAIYGIPVWHLAPLLARISGRGDPTAPWFTPDFFAFSLAVLAAVTALTAAAQAAWRRKTGLTGS